MVHCNRPVQLDQYQAVVAPEGQSPVVRIGRQAVGNVYGLHLTPLKNMLHVILHRNEKRNC